MILKKKKSEVKQMIRILKIMTKILKIKMKPRHKNVKTNTRLSGRSLERASSLELSKTLRTERNLLSLAGEIYSYFDCLNNLIYFN